MNEQGGMAEVGGMYDPYPHSECEGPAVEVAACPVCGAAGPDWNGTRLECERCSPQISKAAKVGRSSSRWHAENIADNTDAFILDSERKWTRNLALHEARIIVNVRTMSYLSRCKSDEQCRVANELCEEIIQALKEAR